MESKLNNLKFNDNNEFQDFIILREKGNFIIISNNFETEENEETSTSNTTTYRNNKIIYAKIGIKSL